MAKNGGHLHAMTVCGVNPLVRAWVSPALDAHVVMIRKMAAAGQSCTAIAAAIGLPEPETNGRARVLRFIRQKNMVRSKPRSEHYPQSEHTSMAAYKPRKVIA